MVAPKNKMELEVPDGRLEARDDTPKTKFWVFGEELIEKEVKSSGNTGRVYLPLDWVGKHVTIIRID